jgi:hypothetical protein
VPILKVLPNSVQKSPAVLHSLSERSLPSGKQARATIAIATIVFNFHNTREGCGSRYEVQCGGFGGVRCGWFVGGLLVGTLVGERVGDLVGSRVGKGVGSGDGARVSLSEEDE